MNNGISTRYLVVPGRCRDVARRFGAGGGAGGDCGGVGVGRRRRRRRRRRFGTLLQRRFQFVVVVGTQISGHKVNQKSDLV